MPLQNRVTPRGEIIATPQRGRFMGNRGILHDNAQNLSPARWRHKAWVTCLLSFKGRKRALMQPGHYTELFFLDEAVAFAAGHRPCGECRRADYNRFRSCAGIKGRIADYDKHLHEDRAIARKYLQRTHQAEIGDLPTGSFILSPEAQPLLVLQDQLRVYSPAGYGPARPKPKSGSVTVLTPAALITVLRAGYQLEIALPT